MAGAEPQTWGTGLMNKIVFVGLDAHKATIAVADSDAVMRKSRLSSYPDFLTQISINAMSLIRNAPPLT
ncbi:hypothetical protein CCR94_17870 [Rhodoblastus sphagnicola]|uniref:Uncharacterized protein n=1 Tax=Rhodoblastus sphagnicola TaxID=333368 RepID=A0A2S6N1D2_9HYPH|nr:hypothetical protein CCR94_17870 [Rhodoblastus sphagnicola]